VHIEERKPWLDERMSVAENVLQARAEGIRPELFENADDGRDDWAALPFAPAFEPVERKSACPFFRSEIDR